MENVWEYDDFNIKGSELKGMTQKGKDKVKLQGLTDMIVPEKAQDGKLPSALKDIEGFAFYNNKLEKVEFNDKLEIIEPSAFAMNNLEHIDLPESIKLIDTSSFYNNKLTEVKIPAGVKKINMYAFRKNNIKTVEVPAGADLHEYAFPEDAKVI